MSIDKKTNGKSNEKVNERNAQKKSATAGGEKMIPKLAHNEPLKSVSMGMTKEEKNKERKKLGKMILKAVGIVLLATIVTLGSVLIYANVKHRKALKEEEKYMTPPGQMVEIDGHEIHVVHRGDETAKHALVFIHSNMWTGAEVATVMTGMRRRT